jgi:UDP:flavonoid glycosyltransferase YjiC (YdhE family)
VPYVALTNAYWSPYVTHRNVPTPCIPLTRLLGVPIGSALFNLSRPLAFAWHSLPLNQLRREHQLPALRPNLRDAYTDADITLYADVPELVPTTNLPASHRYIGPLEWSPDIAMPTLPGHDPHNESRTPLIYVTMGSSGSAAVLPWLMEALSAINCRVVVATAGMPMPSPPPNAFTADYLPGDQLAGISHLVICNGGSPTSQQALARGVPILGIPFNLDQHMNVEYVVRYGAGLAIRPEQASVSAFRTAIQELLAKPRYTQRAQSLGQIFQRWQSGEAVRSALDLALSQRPPPR